MDRFDCIYIYIYNKADSSGLFLTGEYYVTTYYGSFFTTRLWIFNQPKKMEIYI
jgi:hypothetical protein